MSEKFSANQALFSETRKFIFPKPAEEERTPEEVEKCKLLVATALKNLESLGFTLSKDAIEKLSALKPDQIIASYGELYTICVDAVGKNVEKAEVFYPNFPDEVMKMDEADLYLNALCYYFGAYVFDIDIHAHEDPKERAALLDSVNRDLKVINAGTYTDVRTMMAGRIFASTVISNEKKAELHAWMGQDYAWKDWIRSRAIPNKVNKADLATYLYRNYDKRDKLQLLHSMMKDSIDVLRFAAALTCKNEGTPNLMLTGKVGFHLTNQEARDVKLLLSKCKNLYADVWRQKGTFKALGRAITMRKNTPERLAKAYDNLCSNKKLDEKGRYIETPGFRINVAVDQLEKGDTAAFKKVLQAFPGEVTRQFLRCIDHAKDDATRLKIAEIYGECCKDVPPASILTMTNYASMRNGMEARTVRIGKANSYVCLPIKREKLSEPVVKAICEAGDKAVSNYYNAAKTLGKVYIDPELKNNIVPGNDASNDSKGSVLTFGSHVPATEGTNIKRLFLSWSGHMDIDLNATFTDDKQIVGTCAYHELKTYGNVVDSEGSVKQTLYAIHSGDFVDAGEPDGPGVAEFIDIDVEQMRECNVKYVFLNAFVYSHGCFSDLDNVKFGFMEREGKLDKGCINAARNRSDDSSKKRKGIPEDEKSAANYRMFPSFDEETQQEIYAPATVTECVDLNAKASSVLMAIYDVDHDEFLWVDKPIVMDDRIAINISDKEHVSQSSGILNRVTHNPTPTMHQVLSLYGQTYGDITDDITQADVVYLSQPADAKELGVKDGAVVKTAYDLSEFAAEVMIKEKSKTEEKPAERNQDDKDIDDKNADMHLTVLEEMVARVNHEMNKERKIDKEDIKKDRNRDDGLR